MGFSKSVSSVFQILYYKTHGKYTTKSQERMHGNQSNISFYRLRVHCKCFSLGQCNRVVISTGHVVEQLVLPSIPNPHSLNVIYLLKFPGLKGCSQRFYEIMVWVLGVKAYGELSVSWGCALERRCGTSTMLLSLLFLCETILNSYTISKYMLIGNMNRFVCILNKNLWHNKMYFLHFPVCILERRKIK